MPAEVGVQIQVNAKSTRQMILDRLGDNCPFFASVLHTG